jgi:hypothetical protein
MAKNKTAKQQEFGDAPKAPPSAPPAPAVAPTQVEYIFEGVAWRCGKFDLLVAELGEPNITAATLAVLQGALVDKGRAWLIVRRLFGIMPVLPPPSMSPDDLKSWTRGDLRDALGITAANLKDDLDAIRGLWGKIAPVPVQASVTPPPRKSLFSEQELLKKFDFRLKFADQEEEAMFVKRVRDFEKLLEEKMTTGIARNTLVTELQLRRVDERLSDTDKYVPGGSEWKSAMGERAKLSATYDGQMEALNKLAPWSSVITGKYNFQGVVSDITAAMQAYYANNDHALVDGIFTATEIEVECRRSIQAKEPRYRAGLVVSLTEAKAGLWDPNFKSQFSPRQLAALDKAWKAAYVLEMDADGTVLPDLEKAGEAGEYPKLNAAEKV